MKRESLYIRCTIVKTRTIYFRTQCDHDNCLNISEIYTELLTTYWFWKIKLLGDTLEVIHLAFKLKKKVKKMCSCSSEPNLFFFFFFWYILWLKCRRENNLEQLGQHHFFIQSAQTYKINQMSELRMGIRERNQNAKLETAIHHTFVRLPNISLPSKFTLLPYTSWYIETELKILGSKG